jgi:hypothetical protein
VRIDECALLGVSLLLSEGGVGCSINLGLDTETAVVLEQNISVEGGDVQAARVLTMDSVLDVPDCEIDFAENAVVVGELLNIGLERGHKNGVFLFYVGAPVIADFLQLDVEDCQLVQGFAEANGQDDILHSIYLEFLAVKPLAGGARPPPKIAG